MTLIEAVVLVFVVMFLFLQNIRYTIIPTIVVPVALLGACATLLMAGYSINMLTLFGMVLAIGILVDDAIVVVENVERIMAEEGLSPKEATRKAMSQITSAIVGITLVLMAVFLPMAFFPGSVGIIYRQFSVTMVAGDRLLGADGPVADPGALRHAAEAGRQPAMGTPSAACSVWFNRGLDSVREPLCRRGRLVAEAHRPVDGDLCRAAGLPGLGHSCACRAASCRSTTRASSPPTCRRRRMPPSIARRRRSKRVERYLAGKSGVKDVTFLTGYSFLGQGMNTAQAFITLKDWSERGPKRVGGSHRRGHQPRHGVDPRRGGIGPAAAADRQSR